MDINKLLKLFYDTGFLNGDKLRHLMPVSCQTMKTLDILYNQHSENVHRYYTVENDEGELAAHISRIHLWDGTWLCHHHCGTGDGSGLKVLDKMVQESIGNNTEQIKYFCSYYQPCKPFPDSLYGDVYRMSLEEFPGQDLITETPYGYAYINPVAGNSLWSRTIINDRRDTRFWPVRKNTDKQELHKDFEPAGMIYNNYSAPGISFSSYTNSTILHLNRPVTLEEISGYIRPDAPVMWTPINYLDIEPDKVYHLWKAKIDERLYKYFGLG